MDDVDRATLDHRAGRDRPRKGSGRVHRPPETEKNLCSPAGVASTDRRGRDVHARGFARRVVADVSLTVYINRRLHARCFNRKGLASASRRRASYAASNRFSPKHSPSSFFFRKITLAHSHPLLPNRNTCVYEIICRCIIYNLNLHVLVACVVNHVTWNELPTRRCWLALCARPLSTEQSKMAKRLIPLLDRVLVEKIVAPTKSVGGIILPESAVSKVRRAPLPEHRPIGAPPIVGPPLPFLSITD